MNTTKLIASFAAVGMGLAMAGPANAVEEIKITAASGLPSFSAGTGEVINVFIPEVDKRLAATGNYKIVWTTGWGGAIANQFELFEAIKDGLADVGYVNTLFEGAKLPMEQVTYVTPFGAEDLDAVYDVFNALRGKIPEMDQAYEKHNQYRKGIYGLTTYHFQSTFPIMSLKDIDGRKFGAPGLASNWIKNTGAIAVAGSLSQYYNSLKTGVYDGIVIFESGIGPFKFYEVAPHITKVGIGSQIASNVTFNKDKWDSLPDEVREVMNEVSAIWQAAAKERGRNDAAKSINTAVTNGATVTELPRAEVVKLANAVPNIAKQWAATIDEKGLPGTKLLATYMQLWRDRGVDHARAWDKE
ncbi:MAG: C4-dicarboxylate TRAP transporter substrate-binding protein [Proteobacteria bacterium]|nr:C4-dicarboxylate TRAP transporter substrate-binding protein [Pseudomonadota bacterium]